MATHHQNQTPEKPMQLFHIFDESPTKRCRLTTATNSKKPQTFERSNNSPEKTYNPNELLCIHLFLFQHTSVLLVQLWNQVAHFKIPNLLLTLQIDIFLQESL